MKSNRLILAAAIIALAGGILAQRFTASDAIPQDYAQLDIKLPDVYDKPRDIAEWREKILVINFWATWCPPCLREIPEFVELQSELAQRDVQFVGIAIEDKQPVVDFLNTHPVNYPILIGGDAGIALSQRLGNIVGAVPFTVIVDRRGRIVHRHPGELSREKLLEVLGRIIG